MSSSKIIGWWCKWENSRSAGRRLRAERVMRELQKQGIQAEWFDVSRPERYGCVVFSKRYDVAAVEMASRLRTAGCRVVVDLFDNHFTYPPGNVEMRDRAERLRTFVSRVDHVVAASATLAKIVADECPDAPSISTIGDMADDLSVVEVAPLERSMAALRFLMASRRLAGAARRCTRLVWFGNPGGKWTQSGLQDAASMTPALERLHRQYPLHLSVISSKKKRYRALFQNADFPHSYAQWDPTTFDRLLSLQQIALIPAQLDAFTACKTDNRVVTALRAGLAVVASEIPSYRRYAHTIRLGDIESGLRRYLEDPVLRQAEARAGAALAERLSAPTPIIAQWRDVLVPR